MICRTVSTMLALLVPLSMTAAAHAADDPQTLRELIALLAREAKQAKSAEHLPRQEPNAADAFTIEPDAEELSLAITKPAHRDEFVDAYVRWQLTSFEIDLLLMTDRKFEDTLANLPGLIANPMTDQQLVRTVQRAQSAEMLNERDRERLTAMVDDAFTRSQQAREFNKPALELRAWFEKQFESGLRPHQVRLATCAALLESGWPVEQIKRELEAGFEKARRDRDLSEDDRRTLAQQTSRLHEIGDGPLYLTYARFDEEGNLQAAFETSGVYDFDTRKWARIILRQ